MKKKEDKFYEICKLNRSRDFKRSSNSLEKNDHLREETPISYKKRYGNSEEIIFDC